MLFKLKHPKISQPPNRQNEQSTVRRKGLPETALEEKPETPKFRSKFGQGIITAGRKWETKVTITYYNS